MEKRENKNQRQSLASLLRNPRRAPPPPPPETEELLQARTAVAVATRQDDLPAPNLAAATELLPPPAPTLSSASKKQNFEHGSKMQTPGTREELYHTPYTQSPPPSILRQTRPSSSPSCIRSLGKQLENRKSSDSNLHILAPTAPNQQTLQARFEEILRQRTRSTSSTDSRAGKSIKDLGVGGYLYQPHTQQAKNPSEPLPRASEVLKIDERTFHADQSATSTGTGDCCASLHFQDPEEEHRLTITGTGPVPSDSDASPASATFLDDGLGHVATIDELSQTPGGHDAFAIVNSDVFKTPDSLMPPLVPKGLWKPKECQEPKSDGTPLKLLDEGSSLSSSEASPVSELSTSDLCTNISNHKDQSSSNSALFNFLDQNEGQDTKVISLSQYWDLHGEPKSMTRDEQNGSSKGNGQQQDDEAEKIEEKARSEGKEEDQSKVTIFFPDLNLSSAVLSDIGVQPPECGWLEAARLLLEIGDDGGEQAAELIVDSPTIKLLESPKETHLPDGAQNVSPLPKQESTKSGVVVCPSCNFQFSTSGNNESARKSETPTLDEKASDQRNWEQWRDEAGLVQHRVRMQKQQWANDLIEKAQAVEARCEKRRNAAKAIQRAVRIWLLGQRRRKLAHSVRRLRRFLKKAVRAWRNAHKRNRAAARIQAAWHGFADRLTFQLVIWAAGLINKLARGYISRQRTKRKKGMTQNGRWKVHQGEKVVAMVRGWRVRRLLRCSRVCLLRQEIKDLEGVLADLQKGGLIQGQAAGLLPSCQGQVRDKRLQWNRLWKAMETPASAGMTLTSELRAEAQDALRRESVAKNVTSKTKASRRKTVAKKKKNPSPERPRPKETTQETKPKPKPKQAGTPPQRKPASPTITETKAVTSTPPGRRTKQAYLEITIREAQGLCPAKKVHVRTLAPGAVPADREPYPILELVHPPPHIFLDPDTCVSSPRKKTITRTGKHVGVTLDPKWEYNVHIPLPRPSAKCEQAIMDKNAISAEDALLVYWKEGELVVQVLDYDRFNKESFLGELRCFIADLNPKTLSMESWFQLQGRSERERVTGRVFLEITLFPPLKLSARRGTAENNEALETTGTGGMNPGFEPSGPPPPVPKPSDKEPVVAENAPLDRKLVQQSLANLRKKKVKSRAERGSGQRMLELAEVMKKLDAVAGIAGPKTKVNPENLRSPKDAGSLPSDHSQTQGGECEEPKSTDEPNAFGFLESEQSEGTQNASPAKKTEDASPRPQKRAESRISKGQQKKESRSKSMGLSRGRQRRKTQIPGAPGGRRTQRSRDSAPPAPLERGRGGTSKEPEKQETGKGASKKQQPKVFMQKLDWSNVKSRTASKWKQGEVGFSQKRDKKAVNVKNQWKRVDYSSVKSKVDDGQGPGSPRSPCSKGGSPQGGSPQRNIRNPREDTEAWPKPQFAFRLSSESQPQSPLSSPSTSIRLTSPMGSPNRRQASPLSSPENRLDDSNKGPDTFFFPPPPPPPALPHFTLEELEGKIFGGENEPLRPNGNGSEEQKLSCSEISSANSFDLWMLSKFSDERKGESCVPYITVNSRVLANLMEQDAEKYVSDVKKLNLEYRTEMQRRFQF